MKQYVLGLWRRAKNVRELPGVIWQFAKDAPQAIAQRTMSAVRFLGEVWRLAKPYFTSEEKFSAWLLLISVIALNLVLVGLTVLLNFWNNMFYDALQNMDFQAFKQLLLTWRATPTGGIHGIMPGFCEIAAVYILVAIYTTFLTQWLQIRWRRWLTTRFIDDWMAKRAYYHISVIHKPGDIGTDNPDQRIAEDVRDFVNSTLKLSVDFLSNAVTFLSFIGILWSLSGPITLFGMHVPGYMVFVALVYAVVGTGLTHLIGRPLAKLRFVQQAVEADLRYALVRDRENAEGIALYGGEEQEKANLLSRFNSVVGNWWEIMLRTKKLNALTAGYQQAAVIFPFAVAAPRYFSGALKLGGLMQISNAFGQVQGSLSWFVTAYGDLAQWQAIVKRLSTFDGALKAAHAAEGHGVTVQDSKNGAVSVSNLTLELRDGTRLLADENLTLAPGTAVVITGASGSGKSTLFRAIAGIWPFGHGRVKRPVESSLFLPQRAYIPLGTLRHVVTFPRSADAYTTECIIQALVDAGMGHVAADLDKDDNWPQRLSGGEQQRVALARALLFRPDWLFLDEATASLDPASEKRLYETIKAKLPNTTIVSIAHRPTVAAMHDEQLVLEREPGKVGKIVRKLVDR